MVFAQTHRGRPKTKSTRLYAGGELQGSPVCALSRATAPADPNYIILAPLNPGSQVWTAGSGKAKGWDPRVKPEEAKTQLCWEEPPRGSV